MANTNKRTLRSDNTLDNISRVTYGTSNELDNEADLLDKITAKITQNAMSRYKTQVPNDDLVGYANTIGFKNIFTSIGTTRNKTDLEVVNKADRDFSEKMVELGVGPVNKLLDNNSDLYLTYDNYEMMLKHIPECGMALRTYTTNIISPDDYTKRIFDIKYLKSEHQETLKPIIDNLIIKYDLEKKCREIVEDVLVYGKKYVAVLQYTDEFNKMLCNKQVLKNLNENTDLFNVLDTSYNKNENNTLSANDFTYLKLNKDQLDLFESYFGLTDRIEYLESVKKDNLKESNLTESNIEMANKQLENSIYKRIADVVNKVFTLGSKADFLRERFDIETNMNNPARSIKLKLKKSDTSDDNLYINGSSIRYLKLKNVVKIESDGICFGYYYIEYTNNNSAISSLFNNINGYNNLPMVNYSGIDNSKGINKQQSKILHITDDMYDFISSVFLDGISKKLNKNFINNNKQFKDLIYHLVRHNYIKEKAIKITYFKPEEVIEFSADSIFKNSVYVGKLYLATLTNDIIIKLGRAHDKRAFYIKAGAAKDYQAAIQKTISDIKTKNIGFDDFRSINSVLSLSSGRFDDYYIPELPDGTRAVNMETFQGMNTNEDTDLLEYLRKELINSMNLPASVISDMSENIEFARNISAMNAEFLRIIIMYQAEFNPKFTIMLRRILKNEFAYTKTGPVENIDGRYDTIECYFKSPGALDRTNQIEQIQNASTIADFIVQSTEFSDEMTNAKLKARYKGLIIQDMLSSTFDWDKYKDLLKQAIDEERNDRVKNKLNGSDSNVMDPMGGNPGGMY